MFRITPACAGNSRMVQGILQSAKDHPRVCGEQFRNALLSMGRPGSPPRVRGTVASVIAMAGDERITPACAGNRPSMAPSENTVRDHPRVCGEQTRGKAKDVKQLGSPPRVRGTGP